MTKTLNRWRLDAMRGVENFKTPDRDNQPPYLTVTFRSVRGG